MGSHTEPAAGSRWGGGARLQEKPQPSSQVGDLLPSPRTRVPPLPATWPERGGPWPAPPSFQRPPPPHQKLELSTGFGHVRAQLPCCLGILPFSALLPSPLYPQSAASERGERICWGSPWGGTGRLGDLKLTPGGGGGGAGPAQSSCAKGGRAASCRLRSVPLSSDLCQNLPERSALQRRREGGCSSRLRGPRAFPGRWGPREAAPAASATRALA